jgi:hypothetical protein
LVALGPSNADAKGWAGKLGFVDDETALFELRDLDGALLPYAHFALPASALVASPISGSRSSRLFSVVIVESAATFRALPPVVRLPLLSGGFRTWSSTGISIPILAPDLSSRTGVAYRRPT